MSWKCRLYTNKQYNCGTRFFPERNVKKERKQFKNTDSHTCGYNFIRSSFAPHAPCPRIHLLWNSICCCLYFHNALSDDYVFTAIWTSTVHMKYVCVWHLSFCTDLIPPQWQLGQWFRKAHLGPIFHVSCAAFCWACISHIPPSPSNLSSIQQRSRFCTPNHFLSFSHSRAPLNFPVNNALSTCTYAYVLVCVCALYVTHRSG